MTPLLDDLGTVVGFYSRLPAPTARHGLRVADAIGALPLAAVIIALPAALVLVVLLWLGASPAVTALVAAATLVAVTGALHEDGLADCADGLFGGTSPERRLDIMRDSRIGTYGVLALLFAVGLKVALLAELMVLGALPSAALLVAAAVAGRTVALYPWVGLPNARGEGLAASAGRPHAAAFRRALLLAVVVTALLTVWISPLGFVVAAILAAAGAKGVASLADRLIGGHTGDVIGAAVIVGDLLYLAAFAIFVP
jgi:adenosylcobinamide-GDP ribazoletransferase